MICPNVMTSRQTAAIKDTDAKSLFSRHFELLLQIVQLVPYGWYLYLLAHKMDYNNAPDSFRYLWEKGGAIYYFVNSGLSVRLVYSFFSNNINLICPAQLLLVAISQLAIYRCFRTTGRIANAFFAFFLILLFTSGNSRWLFNFTLSESLFVSFYILFTVSICRLVNKNNIINFSIYMFFLFLFLSARSMSAYVSLLVILIIFTLNIFNWKRILGMTVVTIILSASSLYIIGKYDTASELNAAISIIPVIFSDPEKVAYFRDHYDMPVGPFIETCHGGNYNTLCFDYQRIQSGSTYSRNYKVLIDNYGFTDWIREKGMDSWMHYILVHNFSQTIRTFIKGYQQKFSIFFEYDKKDVKENGKSEIVKFMSTDSFVVLKRLFIMLHLDTIAALAGCVALSSLLFLRSRSNNHYLFVTLTLVAGVAMFFIAYFGDTPHSIRHLYPGMFSVFIGQATFLFFIIRDSVTRCREWLQRSANSQEESHGAQ